MGKGRQKYFGTKRSAISGFFIGLVISLFHVVSFTGAGAAEIILPAKPGSVQQVSADQALSKLPLYFIENRGKLDSRVAYYVQGRDKTLYFTSRGIVMSLTGRNQAGVSEEGGIQPASYSPGPDRPASGPELQRWVVAADFVGANPNVKPEGLDLGTTAISYFSGPSNKWRTGLNTYAGLIYRDLWPGIDLVYSGSVDRLKYTFLVNPGADPGRIRLAYRGADRVTISDAGELAVETPVGGFRDERPYSFQEVEGWRHEVTTTYTLLSNGPDGAVTYGFKLGHFDSNRPLVIDPAVLVYCGYIGGTGGDQAYDIAVDSAGNAYVTGITGSTEAMGFPVKVGPDLTFNGVQWFDIFVAKINAAGTDLVYCGYIGGNNMDTGRAIAVDRLGNAYITGHTTSDETSFPVTVGPDLTWNGAQDAFVAKVNAAGTGLDYCGYIGGSSGDEAKGIAVDDAGNAYIAGHIFSGSFADFPVTVGPDLTYNSGTTDAFVAKVNAAGTGLDYCGYIGGHASDYGRDIAVDSGGNAYVTGVTQSTESDALYPFPVTVGPDLTHNGYYDAFVAKVKADGTGLDYCGYIGGDDSDNGFGIAVNQYGGAYVTGITHALSETGFPVIVGPDLTVNGGQNDAFVAKVKANGSGLDYCGYIGGSGSDDLGYGIDVDGAGNAYVFGVTNSTEAQGFPVINGPDLTYNGDRYDFFVAKVTPSGDALRYCGYIGGSGVEYINQGHAIAVDRQGNAYVAGYTISDETSFPVAVGPDLTYNGVDAFVAKIKEGTSSAPVLFQLLLQQ